MARERTYGWTPEQMARINERRARRGQDPYIDARMKSDGGYMSAYSQAGEDYRAKRSAQANNQQSAMQGSSISGLSGANKLSIKAREDEVADLNKMRTEYIKMKQGGGTMNWNDFKESYMGRAAQAPRFPLISQSLSRALA